MSFFLILFQRKIVPFISQNFVTLKEYLFLYTAGCHHHLHFCLIWTGLHNLLNEIVLNEKKNQFFFRNQNYINRFTNYMLWSVKLIPQGVYVKLGKDQPIDDFMTYIFKSFTRIRENFSIKI